MRNLKRALSLTLASVMLLGMMVIGSSAAQGYPDVDENDNVEAIEVLQAIGVMVGDAGTGNFRPDAPVSRAEMAVVMGLLLDLDYNYYVSTCPFADVSGNYEWARGWVGACAANGIIAGRSATSYDPGATVTAIEAASMMMRALGYFQNAEDYADGFQVVTVRQGSSIGIFSGIGSDATTPMTRNQVAQLALNALRSNMVDFTGNLGVEVNGVKVNYRAEYTPRTSPEAKYNAIANLATTILTDNGQYYIQLGEELYNGKLRLDDGTDAFQRPARVWAYDSKEIGTYVKKELLTETYTDKVTGRDLYDLLTKSTIDKYDFVISIDGETEQTYLDNTTPLHVYYFTKGNLIRSNTEGVGGTGKGVLTEVYVDTQEEIVYISIINTYLAKANADFNEKKDEVTFEVWSLMNEGNSTDLHLVKYVPSASAKQTFNLTVKGEDFDVADVTEGDIVLVNVAEGEIQKITNPEVIDDTTISSFKKGSWVNAAGTQYDYASTAQYDEEVLDDYDQVNMKDTNYRVYLDKYGYMIGLEIIEAPSQYAFLTGIDGNKSNIDNKTAVGNLIFTDGTIKTVTINMEKSKAQVANPTTAKPDQPFTPASLWNTWCTYSVDADGVYTLTEVAYNTSQFGTDSNGAAYTNNKTDKVGQGRNNETTDRGAAQTPDSKNVINTIDKKQISLVSAIKDYSRIYGNDDSVYIVAETKHISDASYLKPTVSGTQAIIISGVDSVVTGVQNASLDVFGIAKTAAITGNAITTSDGAGQSTNHEQNTSSGAYTLFKDDGFVIASVVVGEDNGVSSTYAYVTSGVAQEDWRSSSSDWKWYRDVIIDGEEVTLEEIGDSMSELKKMVQNNWYEVKLKADGTVKNVTLISTTDVHSNMDGTASNADEYIFCTNTAHFGSSNDYPKFVGKIELVEQAQLDNSGKVVLFENMTAGNYKLSTKANSLQVDTDTSISKGFSVSPNAKIVLIQDKEVRSAAGTLISYDLMAEITTNYPAGWSGLAQAIKYLNDNDEDGYFQGYISAVFEGGYATSVIIYETDPTLVNWGDANTHNNIDVTVANGDVDVDLNGGSYSIEEIVDAIEKALIKAGYTNPVVDVEDGVIVGISAKKGNTNYKFSQSGDIALEEPEEPEVPEKTMKVTINVVKYDSTGGNVTVPSWATYTLKESDFIDGVYTISALDVGDDWIPATRTKTIQFNEDGAAVTFEYNKKAPGSQEEPPEVGSGHATDPTFNAAYQEAKINITKSEEGDRTIFTITGKMSDLNAVLVNGVQANLSNPMVRPIGGGLYAFVGFNFNSPVTANGSTATSVKIMETNNGVTSEKYSGPADGHDDAYQWVSIAQFAGSFIANQNRTVKYQVTWTMPGEDPWVENVEVVVNMTLD